VDVFCYPRDRSSIATDSHTTYINGISIYFSRLLPVCTWGKNMRTRSTNRTASYGFLVMADSEPRFKVLPEGDWSEFGRQMEQAIGACGYQILGQEELGGYLADFGISDVAIPTIFSDPPYRVYDAIFYWED
jgi:hypothetical protein